MGQTSQIPMLELSSVLHWPLNFTEQDSGVPVWCPPSDLDSVSRACLCFCSSVHLSQEKCLVLGLGMSFQRWITFQGWWCLQVSTLSFIGQRYVKFLISKWWCLAVNWQYLLGLTGHYLSEAVWITTSGVFVNTRYILDTIKGDFIFLYYVSCHSYVHVKDFR